MVRPATQRALELAQDLDVELESVEGSGKGGRIVAADVRARAAKLLAEAPGDLSSEGVALWNDVKSYLAEHGLWWPVYADLVTRYVRNVQRSGSVGLKAEAEPTVHGSQGQTVANPLWTVTRNAELDTHRYAESLLLTPAALKRHLSEGDGDDSDELGF